MKPKVVATIALGVFSAAVVIVTLWGILPGSPELVPAAAVGFVSDYVDDVGTENSSGQQPSEEQHQSGDAVSGGSSHQSTEGSDKSETDTNGSGTRWTATSRTDGGNENSNSRQNQQTRLVNINTATKQQLKTLYGIGDVTADRIIEYREKNGGFKSTEEIKKVNGIGEAKYARIRNQITVS